VFRLVARAMVLAGLAAGAVGSASAQSNGSAAMEEEPILEACSGAEHRQFDFWIGSWEVTDTAGKVVGTNQITRVANGCALNEYWRGARGPTGTSLNFYDPGTGQWHQVWAGLGYFLRLSGGLQDGKMVLSGERDTPQGSAIDRITWAPNEDGTVRQVWEVSQDGGDTWQTIFDGLYSRR